MLGISTVRQRAPYGRPAHDSFSRYWEQWLFLEGGGGLSLTGRLRGQAMYAGLKLGQGQALHAYRA